jgi:uncharacterized membrane protein
VAGRDAFTGIEAGSFAAVWSAVSNALSLSLGLWSLGLFVVGSSVGARLTLGRSVALAGVAVLCLAVVAVVVGVALLALAGPGA